MQDPRGAEATLRVLGIAESTVNTFEKCAKFYWRMWGPLGEPMVRATDQWANLQRSYLRSLREAPGWGAAAGRAEVAERGVGAAERSATEAEEGSREEVRSIVRESIRRSEEGEVPGREAPAATGGVEAVEESTAQARQGSREEISSTIRESVRRSEEGSREEPQEVGTTTAPEEGRVDAGVLPIEEYDSLNVSQVTQRLGELSVEEIERLRDYEAENRNRRSILERFDRRLR
jgi:hypothetical protein